ncbi:MAG: HAD-IB family hydrolase [Pedobacter sp.]|nr:HAD-IB family hydrolase [Pedobacter sp.]MDQ8053932.1 HAD-IB family hydrolase [Pedobacter sp.]
MKETIAVFDFDGTITRKDTLLAFIRFSKGNLRFLLGFLLFSPLLLAMKLRLYPNWKAKEQLFTYFFKGTKIEDFDHWGEDFSAVIHQLLRNEAIRALKLHLGKGHKIIVISASIENWIIPWTKIMGIEVTLATKIAVDDHGRLTGKFLTKNCYGQEKVVRLLEALPNRHEFHIVAYGNSRGDRELLDSADERYYNKFE